MTSTDTIQTLTEEMNRIRATMLKQGKKLLSEHIKEQFAALPAEVTAIRWSQYAPGFNDGEPCVFGVHDCYFKIGETGGDAGDGFETTWGIGYEGDAARKKLAKACEKVDKALGKVPDEIYEAAFGDGYQITVTRDGDVEVEEYSHD